NFTTGGAESNLSAVLAALAHAVPEAGRQGLGAIRARPVIYLGEESHHSFVKIARMTGLGTDVLRTVPTTRRFAMDVGALAERVRADIAAGFRPLMIVATAGTTATGAIDPLPRVAAIAREHGAWFHVDAAWGGAAVLSPRLRDALAGIELADSVTWDAHKWLSVPMGAGMFFCRHPDAVRRAFDITTSYMPAETPEVDDPYRTTVQWSRRAIGLKVFLSVAELGLPGYGELVDRMARMGDRLRERLREAGWIVANDTPLPVVCFTHPSEERGDVTPAAILAILNARGRVWSSQVPPAGGPALLRARIARYLTDESDLEWLVEELGVARAAGGAATRGSGTGRAGCRASPHTSSRSLRGRASPVARAAIVMRAAAPGAFPAIPGRDRPARTPRCAAHRRRAWERPSGRPRAGPAQPVARLDARRTGHRAPRPRIRASHRLCPTGGKSAGSAGTVHEIRAGRAPGPAERRRERRRR